MDNDGENMDFHFKILKYNTVFPLLIYIILIYIEKIQLTKSCTKVLQNSGNELFITRH